MQPAGVELSALQRGMLAVALSDPNQGADVLQVVIRTAEPLPQAAADHAWQLLIDEVDALRVVLEWRGGERPSQHVVPTAQLVSARATGDLDTFLTRDRLRGFQLDVAPLMRVTHLTIPGHGHALVWTVHHVIIDGRSLLALLERWQELFAAALEGHRAAPRAWPSGLDFLAQRLRSMNRDAASAHWKRALDGYAPGNGFSAWPRAAGAPAALHGELHHALSPELGERLERLAAAHGATLNNAVQAAWALTVSCFTGDRDVLFGATRSGRGAPRDGEPEAVGNFVNTVPVRVTLDETWTVAQLLAAARDAWRGSRDFDQVDLADIRAWTGLGGAGPLFESSVGVERYVLQETLAAKSPAWVGREVTLATQTPLPLMLLAHLGARVRLELEYDTARFPLGVAQSLLSTVAFVLEQLADDAAAPLSSLRWVREPVEPAPAPLTPRTYRALLEDAARRHAELAAVEHRGERLTYGALLEQSRDLAARLRAAGVRRGDAVVVLLERGFDLARVAWALQWLGASYTPIEPRHLAAQAPAVTAYPRARFIVSSRALASKLAAPPQPVLLLEALPAPALGTSEPAEPSTPAYTLFTSGSTGVPKPVEVSQHNLAAYAEAVVPYYGIAPGTRWLQLSSLSFDISIEELFVSWSAGGTVVFRPDEGAVDLDSLEALTIDVVSPPTALWHEWAARPELEAPGCLKLVVIGGEAGSMAAWQRWSKSPAGRVRLLNAYGPTEATISATFFEPPGHLEPALLERLAVMPIGQPIGDTRVLLLDERSRRVPLGAPGELVIFGSGVALGYAGAAAGSSGFGEVAVEGVALGRAFRSGDRAFRVPGGDVCFIGRRDRQSKVHGYRVDLDGLGVVAAKHPAVRQAVFQVLGTARERKLVAYVVAQGLDAPGLLAHLRAHVASYALPDAVVFLERLPTTAAGKLDVAALPRPEESVTAAAGGFAGDPVTRAVLAAWQRHLPGRVIEPQHRFFDDLAGDSLTAVRMLAELGTELEVPLAVAILVAADTVPALAEAIRAQRARGVERSHVVPLRTQGKLPPLFLVHGGDGHGLAFKGLVKSLDVERPCYAFEAAPFDRVPKELTVRDMAETYVRELQAVQSPGPLALAGFCMGGLVALEMSRLLRAAQYSVVFLALLNCYAPGWPRLQPWWARGIGAVQGLTSRGEAARTLRGLAERAGRKLRRMVRGTGDEDVPLSPLEQRLHRAQLQWLPVPIEEPVALFRGTPESGWEEPEDLGWRALVRGELMIYPRLRAHHVDMMKEPHAAHLAAQLEEALRQQRG